VAPGNRATFSVAIRTVSIDHTSGRGEYGTGAGITWDSANDAEYDEVIAKAGILTADLPQFDFVETLRLERGRYARLERHLLRLEESAAYFGVGSPAAVRAAARRALEQYAAGAGADAEAGAEAGAGTPQRVRVQVTFDAEARVTSEPYAAPASPPMVALATSPVKRNNRFLYHKTTHRAVYDVHRDAHPGAFDVLLWNEDRELTEFTIGNLVLELEGARYTPPRECGLLAGTFREVLLERGEVAERVLRVDDLARATRLWLVNSVRGWAEVQKHERRE
jgi:para-aminobenzoate synthetase/4-amino-4-deoxychorismate lyase